MIFTKKDRNIFYIAGKKWKINKFIQSSLLVNLIKKRNTIKKIPPFKNSSIKINYFWSFFLKIKGYLVNFHTSRERGFNKIKFFSLTKNVFSEKSLKIQKNLQIINFSQEKNLFVDNYKKFKEFFIIKEPPFSNLHFWNLNSGTLCIANSNYINEHVFISMWRKSAILSTW
jgi:hypothetical protein